MAVMGLLMVGQRVEGRCGRTKSPLLSGHTPVAVRCCRLAVHQHIVLQAVQACCNADERDSLVGPSV